MDEWKEENDWTTLYTANLNPWSAQVIFLFCYLLTPTDNKMPLSNYRHKGLNVSIIFNYSCPSITNDEFQTTVPGTWDEKLLTLQGLYWKKYIYILLKINPYPRPLPAPVNFVHVLNRLRTPIDKVGVNIKGMHIISYRLVHLFCVL